MPRSVALTLLLSVAFAGPVTGQTVLTVPDLAARVRNQNLDIRAADTRLREADARLDEARSVRLPRVDVSEGWQRGDGPIMAFGALLSQRRFSTADFDIGRLNHPDAFDNFRASLVLEQSVFDPTVSATMRTATLGKDVAVAERDLAAMRVVLQAIEAYGRVQLFDALTRAADSAIGAAEADLARAENRRSAGLATDADVLALSVELSLTRVRRLESETEARIARAEMNDLMGEPAEANFTLAPSTMTSASTAGNGEVGAETLAARPDVRLAHALEQVAATGVAFARASFLPRGIVRAGSEWNGATFADRAHSWMVGAEVRVTLFQGFGDRARLTAARALGERRRVESAAAEGRARLEVGTAAARLATATVRIDLARAALASALERQRITRDRYDNGLADVTAILAVGRAVLDAEAQVVDAEVDQVLGRARLDAARGVL